MEHRHAGHRCGRGTAWRSRSSTPCGGAGLPLRTARCPNRYRCAPRRIRRPHFTAPTGVPRVKRVMGVQVRRAAGRAGGAGPALPLSSGVRAAPHRRLAGDTVVIQGAGGLGCTARPWPRRWRRPGDRDRSHHAAAGAGPCLRRDATIDLRELPDAADRWNFVRQRTQGQGADVGLEVAACRRWCRKRLELAAHGGRTAWWATSCPAGEGDLVPHDVVRRPANARRRGLRRWVRPVRWTF